ncbi:unnamed protein product [Caenorhabditis angaria]|uniref:Uncharacterized protein n=1 Tax=Caenorhabditis angaria TaxID=860376 RepID=A0A9P1N9H2_9PELO|nr:unnamed protein product [Caenorhabditis angaria]
MHVDPQLARIEEEEIERDGTHPPDRQLFESELEHYHRKINAIREQIQQKSTWCSQLNQKRAEFQEANQKNSKEFNESKIAYEDVKKQIEAKKKQQLDLENDCRIRNKAKLMEVLAGHEKRYNSANMTARNESILISEIDGLKRNLIKLEKLETLKAELSALEFERNEHREKKEKCWRKFNELKSIKIERKEKEREIEFDKVELERVCADRRKLIEDYNNNRDNYKQWLTNSNHSSVPSTFPIAKKTKAILVDEELEPFYEIKRDCTRLLNYLENLKTSTQLEDSKAETSNEKMDTDDDSADELPPHLVKNRCEKSCPVRRNLKKSTQPISHNIDIYKLFGAIEVSVPQHYSDVPDAIQAVKEKLEFYKNQTIHEFDWADEMKLDLLSISRTTSEFDSACFDDSVSDFGSISSSRRVSSRQSVQSPIL